MILQNDLDEIIKEEFSENTKWNTYMYQSNPVPRVSDILKNMIHDEYLLGWANSLGFKRQSYKKVRDLSADKGTISHNLIEEFLKTNIIKTDFSDIEQDKRLAVYNAYNSFISWYNMMLNNTTSFEILEIEKTLVCPYCGGTLDLLVRIDGKIYVIDLKTSNHMTYKYFIQLGAYTYMLQEYYGYKVDGGVMILWLNKDSINYNDYVLSASDPNHITMMNHCINTFLSLLYAYYNRCLLLDQYNTIFKGRTM